MELVTVTSTEAEETATTAVAARDCRTVLHHVPALPPVAVQLLERCVVDADGAANPGAATLGDAAYSAVLLVTRILSDAAASRQ